MSRETKSNLDGRTVRGGRVLKMKGKVASMAPSLFLAIVTVPALSVGSVRAQTIIDVPQTTPLDVTTNEEVTITSNGAINVASASAPLVTIDVANYSSAFISNGAITGQFGVERAWGAEITQSLAGTAQIVNNGVVNVDSGRPSGNVRTYAFDFAGAVSEGARITNSGMVATQADGAGIVSSIGYRFLAVNNGDFDNSGTIQATASSSNNSANTIGLFALNGVNGTIDNSGTMIVRSDALGMNRSAGADAFRIQRGLTGDFINSGSIIVEATSDTGLASADGLNITSRGVTGNIVNSGALSLNAKGQTRALAYGFEIFQGLTGSFVHSGSASIIATTVDGLAEAYGLEVFNGNVNGMIDNSGALNLQASGDSATTRGYHLHREFTGDFTNSSSIELIATATDGNALAESFSVSSRNMTGTINNSGTVYVRADGTDATARGYFIAGDLIGDFENSGSIEAISRSEGGSAEAYGVRLGSVSGAFSNTGSITATSGGQAYGLYIETFDSEITDVGQIAAFSNSGDAYAIFLEGGSGTLNLDTEDDVTGLIRVNAHDVNLNARGRSNIFRFEDANPDAGTFSTRISDDRFAWFVEDQSGSNPIYAAAKVADLAPSDDVVAFYGDIVGNGRAALTYDVPSEVTRGFSLGNRQGGLGLRPFVLIDAEYRQFDTDGGHTTDVSVFDGEAGFSGQTDNGLAFAAGLGVFRADGSGDTPDFDTTGVYIDAALGRQYGSWTVEGGLGFGWLSTSRTRQIMGSADATADYNSRLLTANLAVEKAFDLSRNVDLLGFFEARYTQQKDDGYTETGSSANATVSDTTTEVIEARLGIEPSLTLKGGGVLKGQLAGVVRRGLGDTETNVTVFSDAQALTFAATDFTGGSIAVGYEHGLSQGIELELTAEQEIGSDAQGPFVRAGLKWAF
ncbi:autotransporter domain-containing protein [Ruegeria sp.]|uniref:autotransporter outer membrane beta-barrel domain-containing protein n=1 Tax=Ruegeria sp. TaxID=1879320 RepID=UPI003C7E67AC